MSKQLEQIVQELKPIVSEIEKSPETTRGHYDRYLIILSKFPQHRQKTMAAILIKAGANVDGVTSALQVLNF